MKKGKVGNKERIRGKEGIKKKYMKERRKRGKGEGRKYT